MEKASAQTSSKGKAKPSNSLSDESKVTQPSQTTKPILKNKEASESSENTLILEEEEKNAEAKTGEEKEQTPENADEEEDQTDKQTHQPKRMPRDGDSFNVILMFT